MLHLLVTLSITPSVPLYVMHMEFKKEKKTFETYGLIQAVDICVAINPLNKGNWKV